MNPPKKEPKPISFAILQAELIQELTREQAAIANETLKLIGELREAHAYMMQVTERISRTATDSKAKVIPFRALPRGGRIQ